MIVLWENGVEQIEGLQKAVGKGLSADRRRGLDTSSVRLHEKVTFKQRLEG